MGIINKISDWKKEKYDPWKYERYEPWKKNKLKPWKKKQGKKVKKWSKDTGKKIGTFVHTFKEAYRESKSDKGSSKSSNFVLKIGNIEHMHIGNKLVYNDNKPPNSFSNKKIKELPHKESNPIDNNTVTDVFIQFEHIKKLYRDGDIRGIIVNCIKLIENIIRDISLMCGFNYENIDHFLFNLSQITPTGKKLVLYDDLKVYGEFYDYIKRQVNQFTSEIARELFLITQRIINKLQNEWSENFYENFKDEIENLNFNSWISKNKRIEYKNPF